MTDKITMGPGIYTDLSFGEYQQIDALNQSALKNALTSWHSFKYWLGKTKERTDAMLLGSAVHCLVFEPERFRESYIRGEKFDRRTSVGKAQHAEQLERAGDKTLLLADTYDQATELGLAVVQNSTAKALIHSGQPEVSIVWQDPETEVLCKARLDYWKEDQAQILDLKTTRGSALPYGFGKTIVDHGYHYQNAWYARGMRALGQGDQRFFFIAVESDAPYGVCTHEIPDDIVARADKVLTTLLRQYKVYSERNEWPAYPEGIHTPILPDYELGKMENVYGNTDANRASA